MSLSPSRQGPRRRAVWPALSAAFAMLFPAMAGAQLEAPRLLVVDQDAHAVTAVDAGALFNVEVAGGVTAPPLVEAAADLGAPFQLLSAVALSPVDGRAYLTDLGADADPNVNAPGAVHAVDGRTGAVTLISDDPWLIDPWDVAVLPDGRLAVVDWESDPSNLGPDDVGGVGHGAVFLIEPSTGAVTLLADGTNHALVGVIGSAFQDPVAIAYDPLTASLVVADFSADPLGAGYAGAIYRLSPTTGVVSLVSSTPDYQALWSVAVRPDGTVLAVDQTLGDSVLWTIDPTGADPETNYDAVTGGPQYAFLESVVVDAADRIHLVDSGEFDIVSGTFIVPPRVWTVDETLQGPNAVETNGVIVNESDDLKYPVGLAAVPGVRVDALAPDVIPTRLPAGCGGVTVTLRGEGLTPALVIDFGPSVAVSSVDPAAPAGLSVTLLPAAPADTTVDLAISHPFGDVLVVPGALTLSGDASSLVSGDPCSREGDANCDGIVDGLDLAILGLHFGTSFCEGQRFEKDADFNDDDSIEGRDLAILATFWGRTL